MDDDFEWVSWAREILAIAQSGLTFTRDKYDRERYEALRKLAVRLMARGSGAEPAMLAALFANETGYATPKVDVRAAIFRDDRILLVQELADRGRWTLPGGWADVNLSASENILHEVRDEAGFDVRVRKIAAVYDRGKHAHPPHAFSAYKMFFLCDILGPAKKSALETGAVEFFPEDGLPELSLDRVLPEQIHRMFDHMRDPNLPTDFD